MLLTGKRFFSFLFFLGACHFGFAQSAYLPTGTNSIYLLNRYEIKSGRLAGPMEFSTSSGAYKRSAISANVDSFNVSQTFLGKQDFFNLDYLQNDNFEWSRSENTRSRSPLLHQTIYKHKAAFYDY